jgi:hypothetical protein
LAKCMTPAEVNSAPARIGEMRDIDPVKSQPLVAAEADTRTLSA